MLLSDNIIYSFWGIDIKWIVFLTIVIWGMIIKIIQSTLLMFDFEQKKTLLFINTYKYF